MEDSTPYCTGTSSVHISTMHVALSTVLSGGGTRISRPSERSKAVDLKGEVLYSPADSFVHRIGAHYCFSRTAEPTRTCAASTACHRWSASSNDTQRSVDAMRGDGGRRRRTGGMQPSLTPSNSGRARRSGGGGGRTAVATGPEGGRRSGRSGWPQSDGAAAGGLGGARCCFGRTAGAAQVCAASTARHRRGSSSSAPWR